MATVVLAGATIVLALATFALAYYAYRQAGDMQHYIRVAEQSASTAREALTRTQRAFVFMTSMDQQVRGDRLLVTPQWRNAGTTPALDVRMWTNWQWFKGEPPETFGFPDQDADGIPIAKIDGLTQSTALGPGIQNGAQGISIPNQKISEAMASGPRLFVWGWSRYKDVFGASHITKFCNEVRFTQTQLANGSSAVFPDFPTFRRNNCADDQCGPPS